MDKADVSRVRLALWKRDRRSEANMLFRRHMHLKPVAITAKLTGATQTIDDDVTKRRWYVDEDGVCFRTLTKQGIAMSNDRQIPWGTYRWAPTTQE